MVLAHLYFNSTLGSFFIKRDAQKSDYLRLMSLTLMSKKYIELIIPAAGFTWTDTLLTLNSFKRSFYSSLVFQLQAEILVPKRRTIGV